MKPRLVNMIADTWNGKMHRDPHAHEGNNSVFYFRNAIREAVEIERKACAHELISVANAYEPDISKDGYDAYKQAIVNGIAAIRARWQED